MSTLPNRETFVSAYQGKPPWDIGKPQREFVAAADRVSGEVLDAGCGTGEIALYFAQRGHAVLGIDYLDYPVAEARRKAAERGVQAEFAQADALALETLGRQFDTVLDSGLFHVFSDADRVRYVEGLAHVTRPGGRLILVCFSDEEPGEHGPRRVSRRELENAFATGWVIEELRPARFEVVPGLKDVSFSEGGPKAWFAVVRRQG